MPLPPTILLVDDRQADADALRMALRIVSAGSPPEIEHFQEARPAQTWLKIFRPILVVSAVQLPDIDGGALVEWIRQQPRIGGLPCYLFGGSTNPDDSDRATLADADGYLVRPHNVAGWHRRADTILKLCDRHLSQSAEADERAAFQRVCESMGLDRAAIQSGSQEQYVIAARCRLIRRLREMGWPGQKIARLCNVSLRTVQRA